MNEEETEQPSYLNQVRFQMALAICNDRDKLASLLQEGGYRRVQVDFPMLSEWDIRRLAKHFNLPRSYPKTRKSTSPRASKEMTAEAFEELSQRVTTRVAELLAEKLLT
jgi:tRNA G46 methylase TrmB